MVGLIIKIRATIKSKSKATNKRGEGDILLRERIGAVPLVRWCF